MRKIILILVLGLFSFSNAFSKAVSPQQAQLFAKAFFIEHYNVANEVDISDVNLVLSKTISTYDIADYYIFNTPNNRGWIIISADDVVLPVLAYSFEANYNSNSKNTAAKYFLKQLRSQIQYAKEEKIEQSAEANTQWNQYKVANSTKGIANVAPLLTTTWDQGCYYNMHCPQDYSSSYCNRALTGCVATSMAQIIKYHAYPNSGLGSNTYTHPVYGSLTANFAAANYDFSNMPNSLSGTTPLAQRQQVGTLMSHCGISVNMNYGPNGSGSNTLFALNAMKDYFKYAIEATEQYKDDYSITNWMNLVRASLDKSYPVLYSGTDNSVGFGHAWVCDGYQGTSMFHMNWGWGGSSDGYFQLSNLVTGGYNFNDDQAALLNMHPLLSGCSGRTTYTTVSGSLDDGSSFNNYLNNRNCQWLISPIGTGEVVLNFTEFNTESVNDVVKIYDGSSTSSPLIATLSGNSNPGMIIANSGQMLITFNTNSTITKSGWKATWTNQAPSNFCGGMKLLNAYTQTFEDGSGMYNNYYSNTYCKWLLRPTGASKVSLVFHRFQLAVGDRVIVYNGATTSSGILGNFTNTNLPTAVQSTQGSMLVVFQTNAAANDKGWSATYYANSSVSVNDISKAKNPILFPNPTKNVLNIKLFDNNSSKLNLDIYNIIGEKVGTYSFDNLDVESTISISVADFTNGVYFLKFESDNQFYTIKFIKQ